MPYDRHDYLILAAKLVIFVGVPLAVILGLAHLVHGAEAHYSALLGG